MVNFNELTNELKEFGQQVVAPPKKGNELDAHIKGSYFSMRIGMAIIGLGLPLALWLGEGTDVPRVSMSDYYAGDFSRNLFVGGLFAIGAFLIAYKGYSNKEDWLLNFAGIFAFIVACIPDDIIHLLAAAFFFLLVALTILFCYEDTLNDPDMTSERKKRYASLYRFMGWAIIIVVLVTIFIACFIALFNISPPEWPWVFVLEALLSWLFGLYWSVKTKEIFATNKVKAKQSSNADEQQGKSKVRLLA